MATVVRNVTESSSGGDGIGLSITMSDVEQINNHGEDDKASTDDSKGYNKALNGAAMPAFIPPSVASSPIPFEGDGNGEGNGILNHNISNSTNDNGPSVISSIMRENSNFIKVRTNMSQNSAITTTAANPAHVAALEDRVRDLEEKLSTLSLVLMQQQTPSRNNSINKKNESYPLSPDDSAISCSDDSSLSPPSTPFRSLASLATIHSSNVPVLESPTPVMRQRRFRSHTIGGDEHADQLFDDFDESPIRQFNNFGRSGNSSFRQRFANGKSLRNNLSYQILHAPNSELDLRSSSSSHSTHSDTNTDNNNKILNRNGFVGGLDDSFERACQVPTLDSQPGSKRTSPILSKDPVVARVLSPESEIAKKNVLDAKDENHSMPMAPTISAGEPKNKPTLRKDASSRTNTSANSSSTSIMNNISSSALLNDSGVSASKPKKKKSSIKSKWLDYLNSVQDTNYDTDKQMEEFVKVPSAVEALLSFGFWICVDSFLYTLTILPLRFVYSIVLLVVWAYCKITGHKASEPFRFHRHNSYPLIQVIIIYTIFSCVLNPIDISIMYHLIRNQSMVKSYLLVAIVEVFDRLLCSLGQDCLDSLYWNTTRRPRSSRLLVSALVVLVYTALHSFLLFVHVGTLNVAMNSSDQALLSLLIGGNFAEIKSTVFKKYNKATLFKITASDICERFKLALFLFLVLTLNASQGMDQKMLYNYMSMCGIVIGGEWLSDWLKHAFITKFNYIASGVYSEYSLLLAGDVSGFGHEGENLDKSHAVVKRLGFSQIPLVVVLTKYLCEAYKYQTYENKPPLRLLIGGGLSVWLLLLISKFSLASLIERMSRKKLESAPEFSKTRTLVAKKRN